MADGLIGFLSQPFQSRPEDEEEAPRRVGDSMAPTQARPEEYEQRVQQNREWLQDPKTQAALMAFAINIMQPVGGSGGLGDFVGAFGRSVGAGAQAAAGVEEAQNAAQKQARDDALEEQKFGLEKRRVGLSARELDLKERELLSQGAKGVKFSKLVNWADPINEKFGLGIPRGKSAKVEVTYDSQTGEPIGASYEADASPDADKLSGKAAEISDLHKLQTQYEEAGDVEKAAVVKEQIEALGGENKTSKVISGDDPLNTKLGLGIPKGSNARVTLTLDDAGNPTAGSVEGQFGTAEKPTTLEPNAQEIVDMFTAADRYEAQAQTVDQTNPAQAQALRERAKVMRTAAFQKSQQFSLTGGTQVDIKDQGNIAAQPSAVEDEGVNIFEGTNIGQAKPASGTVTQTQAGSSGPEIIPIPGGKVALDQAAEEEKKAGRRMSAMNDSLTVRSTIDEIRTVLANNMQPDYLVTGGVGSILANLPFSTDARIVAKKLDTLKGVVSFQALQDMREASPTGGALGQVSDFENKLLQSTKTSLDQFQGTREDFEASLLKLQYIFDPAEVDKRGEYSRQVQKGLITAEQAQSMMLQDMDRYIYPESANEKPPVDLSEPPDYVADPEARNFWNELSPAEKKLFLNEEDSKRVIGE